MSLALDIESLEDHLFIQQIPIYSLTITEKIDKLTHSN